jgi:hypothetical protein
MQRPRKVLILCNLPPRDWQVDTILAEHLSQMGFEVRLTNLLPRPREHIIYFKPDIVIGPEARCQFTVDLYKKCKDWGIWTVVRRCEGGTAQGAWDVMEQPEKDTVIGAWEYDVDLELVWSEKFKDLISKHGFLPVDRYQAIGGVPFDPYFRPPHVARPNTRRNILVAPGWGHADTNPKYNVPEAPPDSPIHADAFKRHRRGREAWLDMILQLHKAVTPMWNVLLSLKVGEQPTEYQQRLANRVQYIQPGQRTKDVLDNVDFLVHPGSTLGLEAHLSGLPGQSFCGMYNQTNGYAYPHVHPDTEDIATLIKRVKETPRGKSNANVDSVKELEREFYGVIDGKAMERAAILVASLPMRNASVPDVWPAETKEYNFPGVSKTQTTWICEACQRPVYVIDPTATMISCVNCGISLSRR